MKRDTRGHHGSALVVAVGDYKDPAYDRLEVAPQAAQGLAQALANAGFRYEYPDLLHGGEKKDITPSVDRWFRDANEDDVLIFFWTGHGKSEAEGHYLITKDSPGKGLNGEVAFAAGTLGAMVANSPADKILVVLDTCYSGAGATDVANTLATVLATRVPKAGRSRAVAVIASAHPLKKAQEGRLCGALTKVLADPQARRSWSDNDQYVRTSVLAEALEESVGVALGYKADGPRQEFVPNPRYRGALPATDMETRSRQLTMPEAQAHFLPASRGIEVGEITGWYFTGRERLLTELVEWITTAGHGMTIVTGTAGAGKSAVTGRLAILSDPEYRALAITEEALSATSAGIPPARSIDVAVHAKGKTLADCALALADGLDIDLSGEDGATLDATQLVDALLEAISADHPDRRFTFLVDALDEAHKGHPKAIGSRLLKPLAALPNVRVLVGVRRDPDGGVLPETEARHARLHAIFGDQAIIHDLEDEADTAVDIVDYVRKRLGNSRHKDKTAQIETVANATAERADGNFLYARVVSRTLMDLERLDGPLPNSALEAFVADLTLRFKDDTTRVHDMLRALAWGEGKGLTRRVWAPIASVLSREGPVYDDDDIRWVLDHAGAHIVESGEDGQAVYRLGHQAFADYYRTQHEAVTAHGLITRAVTEGMSGISWLDADGYLVRNLASHAAAAGALPKLIPDPGYLITAEPEGLLSALLTAPGRTEMGVEVSVYELAVHLMRVTSNTVERASYLEMVARQFLADDLANRLAALPLARLWRTTWATWRQPVPHQSIRVGKIGGLFAGAVDGAPVLVTVGNEMPQDNGSVIRVWDPDQGSLVGPPIICEGELEEFDLATAEGRTVVVVRFTDGGPETENRWRGWEVSGGVEIVPLPESIIRDRRRLSSRVIQAGILSKEPVVAHMADGTIRFEGAESKRQLLSAFTLPKESDDPYSGFAVTTGGGHPYAFGMIGPKPVLATSGMSGIVRTWFADNGKPAFMPCFHGSQVLVLWITTLRRGATLISAGVDGIVRLWELQPIVETRTLDSHASAMAVALDTDEPTAAVALAEGSIELCHAKSGKAIRALLSEPGTDFRRVAAAGAGKELVVAAWTEAAVWVLDYAGRVVARLPTERYGHPALAIGSVGNTCYCLPGIR